MLSRHSPYVPGGISAWDVALYHLIRATCSLLDAEWPAVWQLAKGAVSVTRRPAPASDVIEHVHEHDAKGLLTIVLGALGTIMPSMAPTLNEILLAVESEEPAAAD